MTIMELGVMVNSTKEVRNEIKKVRDLGFSTCQVGCADETLFTDEYVELIKKA